MNMKLTKKILNDNNIILKGARAIMEKNKQTKIQRKLSQMGTAFIPHEEQFLMYYDANLEGEQKVELVSMKDEQNQEIYKSCHFCHHIAHHFYCYSYLCLTSFISTYS